MIGVAISTHKRPHVLTWALTGWATAMPDLLVVNHDREGTGVAATKNQGIKALMDAGCEHLFLADDDVRPKIADWWQPYIDSPHPHLIYCRPTHPAPWTDKRHRSAPQPNGVLMYVHCSVIEQVGGLRVEFGQYGSEHGEWSRRIHNAGLTPHPFIGLSDDESCRIWHALDFEEGVESTVDPEVADADWPRRNKIRRRYWDSAEFVEYR